MHNYISDSRLFLIFHLTIGYVQGCGLRIRFSRPFSFLFFFLILGDNVSMAFLFLSDYIYM